MSAQRKVAIVHDWFVNYAGAEKVVEQLLLIYPDADLFSVVDFLDDSERGFLGGRKAKTTFIQHLPKARTMFRNYLPLMPIAIEQLDLSRYDLVISSAYAVAKGVLTGPDQTHISYIHSPIRYAWDLQHQYLNESGLTGGLKSMAARAILHYMRLWDQRTAPGVDEFVANSHFISRRVHKVYRRDAKVIYPPVNVSAFPLYREKEEFYLTASRMVPYKKMPLIVEAFSSMPDKRLVVIGDGPELSKAQLLAGPNVSILGYQPFDSLRSYMQRAKAFVFAAEEDFGIAPVEAQACGTPVIAYGKGGALETVRVDGPQSMRTGMFFYEQTASAICDAVREFEQSELTIRPEACRKNAEQFVPETFRRRFSEYVEACMGGTYAVPLIVSDSSEVVALPLHMSQKAGASNRVAGRKVH